MHFSLALDLRPVSIHPITLGYSRAVEAAANNVPMVAPPSRLWRTSLFNGNWLLKNRNTIGISTSGKNEPTIRPGRLSLPSSLLNRYANG